MKFTVTNKITKLIHDGKTYMPGDVVELPEKYMRHDWLKPVEPVKKAPVKMPEPKIEPVTTPTVKTEARKPTPPRGAKPS